MLSIMMINGAGIIALAPVIGQQVSPWIAVIPLIVVRVEIVIGGEESVLGFHSVELVRIKFKIEPIG